eukprot:8025291-Prorocentrum_lima.AAC.1
MDLTAPTASERRCSRWSRRNDGAPTRPGHVRAPALLHWVCRGLDSGGGKVGRRSGAWGGAA